MAPSRSYHRSSRKRLWLHEEVGRRRCLADVPRTNGLHVALEVVGHTRAVKSAHREHDADSAPQGCGTPATPSSLKGSSGAVCIGNPRGLLCTCFVETTSFLGPLRNGRRWPLTRRDPEAGVRRFDLAMERVPNVAICDNHPSCLTGPEQVLVGFAAIDRTATGATVAVIRLERIDGELLASIMRYDLEQDDGTWVITRTFPLLME